ncbi:MAG: nucleotidyl transferase AbiEii/AbiGii toxin family protein [Thermoplasmatota archaeon]
MDLSGYSPTVVEKVSRLFDVLEQISKVKFLSDRLCFYGGTALNFIHYSEVPRLSVDLDFNYRHIDEGRDWGYVRTEIDGLLMRVLSDIGYKDEQIKVQAHYPLGRMDIKYVTGNGLEDNIKLETGYMRRIPILTDDQRYTLENPGTGSNFKILSPKREELYANKFCTMISRNKTQMNARDVFDVHTISRSEFNMDLFMDIVMIEGLMMGLDLIDIGVALSPGSLSNIEDLVVEELDLDEISYDVNTFSDNVQEKLVQNNWPDFQEYFKKRKEVDHSYFNDSEKINPHLDKHPQLQWMIKRMEK